MRQARSWQNEVEEEWRAADRQTASLAGLAAAVLLIVVGLFLVHRLHRESVFEDCLLAGRNSCEPILAEAAPERGSAYPESTIPP